jgi:hypothetical protein
VAIQPTTDEEFTFVNDAETLVLSRQFAKSTEGIPQRPVIELIIPVTVIG